MIALLIIIAAGYAATYYMLWAVIKENRTLRNALLQVQRPDVAGAVRRVEKDSASADEEPEQPRLPIWR